MKTMKKIIHIIHSKIIMKKDAYERAGTAECEWRQV